MAKPVFVSLIEGESPHKLKETKEINKHETLYKCDVCGIEGSRFDKQNYIEVIPTRKNKKLIDECKKSVTKTDTDFIPSELVSVKLIQESTTNQRHNFDQVSLQELADSIKSKGILSPLLLRPKGKGYEVVFGARRFRAAKLAGLKEVPANVRAISDDEAIDIQIIENIQRQDINSMEEAEGFKYLIENKKYEVKSIAEKIGKSESYVRLKLQLNKLIPKVADLLRDNKFTYAQASLIARLSNDKQAEILKAIGNDYESSPSEIRKWIQNNNDKELSKAPFRLDLTNLINGVVACTICPYNTAVEKELFPELSKKNICTNPKCYNEKVKANLERKINEFKDKGIEPVQVCTGWGAEMLGSKKLIGEDTYTECKEKDKGAKPAIIMKSYDQSKIGKVIYIKDRSTGSGSSSSVGSGKSINEKINEARNKNNNIIRIEAFNFIMEKILIELKEKKDLSAETKKAFLKIAFSHIDHDTKCKIKNLLKWDVMKYKKDSWVDYDKFLIENFVNKAADFESTIFYILWALLVSKSLGPDKYNHYDGKFDKQYDKDNDLTNDYIFILSEHFKFDYPGKLKTRNDDSIAKLKEKSKPAKKKDSKTKSSAKKGAKK